MRIIKLTPKVVQTKFGEKEKYLITDEAGKMFDSFVGNWNKGWKEGDEITIAPEQISEREYQGKKYYTINAPAGAKAGNSSGEILSALRQIYSLESQILTKINQLLLKERVEFKQVDEVSSFEETFPMSE